jgi:hypothetical protein
MKRRMGRISMIGLWSVLLESACSLQTARDPNDRDVVGLILASIKNGNLNFLATQSGLVEGKCRYANGFRSKRGRRSDEQLFTRRVDRHSGQGCSNTVRHYESRSSNEETVLLLGAWPLVARLKQEGRMGYAPTWTGFSSTIQI